MLLALPLGLLPLLVTSPLDARPSDRKPAPPQGGWIVDRVRVESLTPGGTFSIAGTGEFRGALELVRSGSGVGVVNHVALEDYVRGIAEVPNGWPIEALRAQAIAARTYAFHEVKSRTSATELGADICPTQACQVYVGVEKERSEGGERWVSAVESTRGQVLLRKGEPIRAMYSAGPYSRPSPPPGVPAPPPGPVRGHGVGMDQHGALAKALRGASASAILARYYGGARPTRLAPPRLPESIRVGLDGRSSVSLTGSARFRVLDGSGQPVAVVATGTWRVLPGPQNKLRVLPPPGQEATPGLEALAHDATPPVPGDQPALRLKLSGPALVHLRVEGPDGSVATATPPQLMEAGEAVLPLPPLPPQGPHVVAVVADAGANRVVRAPVDVAASGPAPPNPAPPPAAVAQASPLPVLPVGTAFVLLLAVSTALAVSTFAGRPGAGRDQP